jgi:pyrimidine operon attenuation protein/uracil phosphoribosyltransferase
MAGEVVRLAGGVENLISWDPPPRGAACRPHRGRAAGAHGPVATGTLDITLYRDDLMSVGPRAVVGAHAPPVRGSTGK